MQSQLALYVVLSLILYLFFRGYKVNRMPSLGLWISLCWIIIIGSRPVSMWFTEQETFATAADYLEGSPIDRWILSFLIIAGLIVLLRRRLNWRKLFASNRWVLIFFFYWLISIMWSHDPFVSFKRLFKDFGNVVMILIIITEKDPVQALRAVFARLTYVVIPLSIILILYYPALGRYINKFPYDIGYCGVATHKNLLGSIVCACGVFLIWDLIKQRIDKKRHISIVDFLGHLFLLLMISWLIVKIDSSTSLVSLILGACILFALKLKFIKRQVEHLGTWGIMGGLIIFLIYAFPEIPAAIVRLVGRDMTFTGRTEMWAAILRTPINFLAGSGYSSYWQSFGMEFFFDKYETNINQAHNGYLETYVNGGILGVFFLMTMIVATGKKLKKQLLEGNSYGALCFSFFILALVSNWTEATFNRLNITWIMLLIASLQYSQMVKIQDKKLMGSNLGGAA